MNFIELLYLKLLTHGQDCAEHDFDMFPMYFSFYQNR